VSPKEQVQAIALLREWVERIRPGRTLMSVDELELLERTEAFLRTEGEPPESHGDRRR